MRLSFLASVFALLAIGRTGWAGEDVKPPDCQTCQSTGCIVCPECKGSGRSDHAPIDCPACKGKGKVPCAKCKGEGKVRCKNCSKRKLNGEETYAEVSPEWTAWNKKWGSRMSSALGKRPDYIPEPPARYVPCSVCGATGKADCPDCKGEKTVACKKCGGTGKITGPGPCPTCHGLGKAPCPDCASLPGLEKLAAARELQKLLASGVLTNEEYFQRLRILVAQEKLHPSAKPADGDTDAKSETDTKKGDNKDKDGENREKKAAPEPPADKDKEEKAKDAKKEE